MSGTEKGANSQCVRCGEVVDETDETGNWRDFKWVIVGNDPGYYEHKHADSCVHVLRATVNQLTAQRDEARRAVSPRQLQHADDAMVLLTERAEESCEGMGHALAVLFDLLPPEVKAHHFAEYARRKQDTPPGGPAFTLDADATTVPYSNGTHEPSPFGGTGRWVKTGGPAHGA